MNRPDDYLGKHGATAFFTLMTAAKAVKHRPPEKPKPGRTLTFVDPEPWPDPVDGAGVLARVSQLFSRYVALPPHAETVLTLWTAHTYAMELWSTSPILALTSPTKRCGKTLVLVLLGALSLKRLFASSITPAALFRTVEQICPTLLIDEADTFLPQHDELRGILNSGHTRRTAMVIRTSGEDHAPRAFSTWSAKAIALIGALPSTLEDRALVIRMRRRGPGDRVTRLRHDRIDDDCLPLQRQLRRWMDDVEAVVHASDPALPAALHDRAQDNWRALFIVAAAAGGEWPAKAHAAALAFAKMDRDSDDTTELESMPFVVEIR